MAIIVTIAQISVLRYEILAVTRFFLGILLGMSAAITPIYLNSIAPSQVSGKLGTYNQVFQTLGVLFAYGLGTMIVLDEQDQIRWRFYIGFPILFLLLRIIALQFIFPFDTIQRHIQLNQMHKLKQFCSIVYLNDSNQTVQSLISSKMRQDKQQTYSATLKKRLIVAIIVIASNQLTGINGILYYAKQLFSKVTQGKQQYSQILIIQLSLLQVVSTLISSEIVDSIGRKKILLTGQGLIGVILFGIFVFDTIGGKVGEFGVLILLFLHILVLNITLGPICIVYCTEILNDIAWVIFTLKGCAFLIALTTEYMIEYWGLGLMFLLFFGLTVISFFFLSTRLHETGGKTRQEVYKLFQTEKPNNPESIALIQNQE